ncbi:glycosyltransferase family 2 protein [Niabella sp. CJ426]|uniref:glycosyltransferase family 2 protein n=1 Tax=Niabella sp. CJ426 TaxID=3393740 RepID=UPI003CFC50CF
MTELTELTASIVLYKTNITEMKKAISSFLNTSINVHIFLVDNSPNDQLRAALPEDSRITYIPSHDNPGFGSAHNLALREAISLESKYHLILNPDIEFTNGVLEELYTFMDENETVGNVMPKVYYGNGELQRLCKLLPTPFDLLGRRFLKGFNFSERRNSMYELKAYQYDKVADIPNLSGCFMFIRTSVLKKIGGFDERYFMYLEDIDLNRRIQAVARTVCNPKVSIIHGYHKESYSNSKLLVHHIKSAIKYFNKWGWFFDKKRQEINKKAIENLYE